MELFAQVKLIDNSSSSVNYSIQSRGPVGASVQLGKRPDYPQVTEIMWLSAHVLEKMSNNFKGLPDDIENIIPIEVGDFKLVSFMKKFFFSIFSSILLDF